MKEHLTLLNNGSQDCLNLSHQRSSAKHIKGILILKLSITSEEQVLLKVLQSGNNAEIQKHI